MHLLARQGILQFVNGKAWTGHPGPKPAAPARASADPPATRFQVERSPIRATLSHPVLHAMLNTLGFFNLGGQEMIIVFLIVLLLFGAKKLPELARGIGKSMGEFKRAREDFEREIHNAEIDDKSSKAAKTEAKAETRTETKDEPKV